jgi:hypothetical protein
MKPLGEVMVSPEFTANARRLGIVSAAATVLLAVAYAVVLALGLASLHSPQQPIGDPFLPLMEILITLTAPAMVAVMVSVHAWASPQTKVFSLAALVFIGLMAALTCAVHFAILSLSRQPVFASQPWAPLFFGWTWPSVVYALDIMAGTSSSPWRCCSPHRSSAAAVWRCGHAGS